ncbi:MAG: hypothetical protein HOG49_12810 [Candidatus Scalindua sp.]|jgi:nicotinic acid mononucleotide adenylyltransferase|nr:hypothetical protein [Candidatus Scalindua sp.]
MRTIHIYGGSFDPPHLGHMAAVEYLNNKIYNSEYPSSDLLLICPSFNPFKIEQPLQSDYNDKVAMCAKAFPNNFILHYNHTYMMSLINHIQIMYYNVNIVIYVGDDDTGLEVHKWQDIDEIKKCAAIESIDLGKISEYTHASSGKVREHICKAEYELAGRLLDGSIFGYIIGHQLYKE